MMLGQHATWGQKADDGATGKLEDYGQARKKLSAEQSTTTIPSIHLPPAISNVRFLKRQKQNRMEALEFPLK